MSIKLFGKSQILRKDECITILREGTNIPRDVIYKDGKPVKLKPFTFMITANVQPLNARDLLLVPEGDRFKEQWWLYFENKDIVTEEGIEIEANSLVLTNDQVLRLGIYYQVQGVENWGSYSRSRIMRVDVGPLASN